MRKISLHLFFFAMMSATSVILASGCSGSRRPVDVERKVNAKAPKIVAEDIRLDGASAIAEKKITFTYTLISFRISNLNGAASAKQFLAMLARNDKRAETEEAKGLFAADVTVSYRYLDSEGKFIVEDAVTPTYVPCEVEKEPNQTPEPTPATGRGSS